MTVVVVWRLCKVLGQESVRKEILFKSLDACALALQRLYSRGLGSLLSCLRMA